MHQDNSNRKKTITFDQVKKPLFTIKDGYRVLERRLRTSGWKVTSNDKEIRDEILSQASIYVISAPQMKFTNSEFDCLKRFIENSGTLWILLCEGGEKRLGTNINFLLEQYGFSVNNDSVIRQSYYKYFDPKEVLISNGVLNRNLIHTASRLKNQTTDNSQSTNQDNYEEDDLEPKNKLSFLFVSGATINVEKPAIPLLSTGIVSFPINRPVCGLYMNEKVNGKLILLGSSSMFTDKYIEKEDNALLLQIILQYSLEKDIQLNSIDSSNPDINEYHALPNIDLLANQPMPYFEESEKIPSDFTRLIFESSQTALNNNHSINKNGLFQFDNSTYPLILGCYNEFNMEHEPLTLIKPAFETPLPKLEPSLFAPRFRGLTKPILELYDLDEEFCTVPARLQQLANKCTDTDLDYFVQECGRLLGIVDANTRTSKEILERTFKKIIEYKKVNQKK